MAILAAWLLRSLAPAPISPGLGAATVHSLTLGGWTALIATVCALPMAILLVRYPGSGARAVERLTYLGYALPGLVVALAFVAFGAGPPSTRRWPCWSRPAWSASCPRRSARRERLLAGQPALEEAARGLGRSQAGRGGQRDVAAGAPGHPGRAALVLLTAMKELPATLLLSPTGWDTLAVEVWTAANDAAYGEAAAPALILIAVAAVPMLLLAPRDRISEQAPLIVARRRPRTARPDTLSRDGAEPGPARARAREALRRRRGAARNRSRRRAASFWRCSDRAAAARRRAAGDRRVRAAGRRVDRDRRHLVYDGARRRLLGSARRTPRRHGLSGLRPLPPPQRGAQRRLRLPRNASNREARVRRRWRRSGWPVWASARRTSSRAGSSSAWRWPAPWLRSRR